MRYYNSENLSWRDTDHDNIREANNLRNSSGILKMATAINGVGAIFNLAVYGFVEKADNPEYLALGLSAGVLAVSTGVIGAERDRRASELEERVATENTQQAFYLRIPTQDR